MAIIQLLIGFCFCLSQLCTADIFIVHAFDHEADSEVVHPFLYFTSEVTDIGTKEMLRWKDRPHQLATLYKLALYFYWIQHDLTTLSRTNAILSRYWQRQFGEKSVSLYTLSEDEMKRIRPDDMAPFEPSFVLRKPAEYYMAFAINSVAFDNYVRKHITEGALKYVPEDVLQKYMRETSSLQPNPSDFSGRRGLLIDGDRKMNHFDTAIIAIVVVTVSVIIGICFC